MRISLMENIVFLIRLRSLSVGNQDAGGAGDEKENEFPIKKIDNHLRVV